jgi:ADP-heptose:LPS heptosyltransferase
VTAHLDWTRIERLLVVRLDNMGDVVMLAPALSGIRAVAPNVGVTLLASPAGAEAAQLIEGIDEVIAHRASWQQLSTAPSPVTELALISRLSEGRFDAAIIFTSFSQDPGPPALACYLAGIRERAGWTPLFLGAVLTHPVAPPPVDGHQVERNVELVRALGAPPNSTAIGLRVPAAAARKAEQLIEEAGVHQGDYAALLPGASAPARRYPAEGFAEAARHLWEAARLPTLVIGGERDHGAATTILGGAGPGARSLVGTTDLATAAALVERSALVLSNNSLGIHLADAFRVPVVAAFSGTDLESQWAPRFAPSRMFRRITGCSPCYSIDCPFDLACLDVPGRELAVAGLQLAALPRLQSLPATGVTQSGRSAAATA